MSKDLYRELYCYVYFIGKFLIFTVLYVEITNFLIIIYIYIYNKLYYLEMYDILVHTILHLLLFWNKS